MLSLGDPLMWLLTKKENDLVSISCTSHTIACAWMRSYKEKSLYMYELKGYKRIGLDRFELANGYIHNPTAIESHIASFLTKHALKNASISIGLRGPSIYENIVNVPSATDAIDAFLPKKQQQIGGYRYLYSQDNAQATFYVCSVPQSLLFQYRLLALRQQLNLVAITTLSMAYLSAYVYGYGAAFRHSQLAYDIARCKNFDDLVSLDSIRRCLTIPRHYSNELASELPIIIPLLGLAMSQKVLYETD